MRSTSSGTRSISISPATRDTKAAKRFLGKALRGWKDWELPVVLNTDKAPTYAGAIVELKAEGKCPDETRPRQVKYLNNVVEADHGKLKQLIQPVRGYQDDEDGLRHDAPGPPHLFVRFATEPTET